MKNAGAVAVVVGFVVWVGGEFVIVPFNLIGLLILFAGAVLYFIGRRRAMPDLGEEQRTTDSSGNGEKTDREPRL